MKDSPSQPQTAAQPPVDFAEAIAPLTTEAFFQKHFEKTHLVIRREDPDYYTRLLSLPDIDRVLTQMLIPAEDIKLVQKGRTFTDDDYIMPSGFADPVRVINTFGEGATVVLPGLQKRLPKLQAYCRSLETVFSCDLQTNIYFTPPDAQGFKTHYDSHDVIVLQIAGSKTWNIYESPLELPLRSQGFEPEGFEAGALIDTFTLQAGDMCYVPRGVVHDARATDELSLHITTGLLTPRWIDLIVEAVSQLALDDAAFRRAVPPGYANEGFDQAPARQTFKDLLQRAVDGIDAGATLDSFGHEFRRRRIPVVPGQLMQMFNAEAIGLGTELRRRPDLIPLLSLEGDEVVLAVFGAEIRFPAHVADSLRDALGREGFRVGELAGDLDEAGQAVMARRLVQEGVLFAV
ncbi:cupin domain-containing protein [Cereibacter sphaeroides]|nr:cupin domain-containing protein [Cereibacter sphaeroides]